MVKIIKDEKIEVKKFFRVKKACCDDFKDLYNCFSIITLEQATGILYIEILDETGYVFLRKMYCCPFCGEKVEVEA